MYTPWSGLAPAALKIRNPCARPEPVCVFGDTFDPHPLRGVPLEGRLGDAFDPHPDGRLALGERRVPLPRADPMYALACGPPRCCSQ